MDIGPYKVVKDFSGVRVDDVIVRMLAGTIPMKLKVAEVTDKLILTYGGWTFDRKSGVEVDEDLKWGPEYGVTGSYLVGIVE